MDITADVRQRDGSSDRRWVVLLPDGSVSTLGRARDPSDDEVLAVETALAERELNGWLAVQSHSLYRDPPPTFMQVRPLGTPVGTFGEAVAAVLARREAPA